MSIVSEYDSVSGILRVCNSWTTTLLLRAALTGERENFDALMMMMMMMIQKSIKGLRKVNENDNKKLTCIHGFLMISRSFSKAQPIEKLFLKQVTVIPYDVRLFIQNTLFLR